MTNYAEQMDAEEVDQILEDCKDLINDGWILIDEFAYYLMGN